MNRFLILWLLTVGCFKIFAQEKESNMNSLVSTEYAFALIASEVGTRDAFLKFIADDGILFRPNPVNGKDFLNNSKPSSGLLHWYPSFAFVARSGDLGFTTGPWKYRRDKNDTIAVAFGNYCTVWQRQLNGEWKFVIDFGNSNAKPEIQPVALKIDTSKLSYDDLLVESEFVANDDLITLDNMFTEISSTEGVNSAYEKYVTEDSRLLRNGNSPIIGQKQILEYMTYHMPAAKFNPIQGKISLSKDFGFTYGELEMSKPENQFREKFYYMHIWKKEGKRWIMLVEVANKIQK